MHYLRYTPSDIAQSVAAYRVCSSLKFTFFQLLSRTSLSLLSCTPKSVFYSRSSGKRFTELILSRYSTSVSIQLDRARLSSSYSRPSSALSLDLESETFSSLSTALGLATADSRSLTISLSFSSFYLSPEMCEPTFSTPSSSSSRRLREIKLNNMRPP